MTRYHDQTDRIFVRGVQGAYNLQQELERLRSQPRVRKAKDLKLIDGPQAYSRLRRAQRRNNTDLPAPRRIQPGRKITEARARERGRFLFLMARVRDRQYPVRLERGRCRDCYNNCVHQHFNASETEPARALVIKTKPMYLFLNMLFQQTVEARHKDPAGTGGFRAPRRGRLQPPRRRLLIMAWQNPSSGWMALKTVEVPRGTHEALTAIERNSKRKKVVHPSEMPWELAPQGILKHLINEQMNTRMETVDAYMQIIPRDRSGNTDTSPGASMFSRDTVMTSTRIAT